MRTITIPVSDELEAKMVEMADRLCVSIEDVIKLTVMDFGMSTLQDAVEGDTDMVTDGFIYPDRPTAEKVAKRLMADDGSRPMPAHLHYRQDGKEVSEVFEPGDFALPESDNCRALIEAMKRKR